MPSQNIYALSLSKTIFIILTFIQQNHPDLIKRHKYPCPKWQQYIHCDVMNDSNNAVIAFAFLRCPILQYLNFRQATAGTGFTVSLADLL